MYQIANELRAARAAGTPAVVARAVELYGFGARTAGEALLIAADGKTSGQLLRATVTDQVVSEAEALLLEGGATRLTHAGIPDVEAVGAGFACGGLADILLQRVDAMPIAALDALRASERFVLVSVPGTSQALTLDADGAVAGQLESPELHEAAVAEAQSLLAGGVTATRSLHAGEGRVVIESFVPVTHLLVVGDGVLAEALGAQAELLGWEWAALGDDREACEERVRAMTRSDAVVLLTHNRAIDVPILAAAIRGGVGYVGGLGSRMNQAGRRKRLEAFGLTDAEMARYHGPVGLDIGAANPAEMTLAICAEIISVLRGRDAGPLSGTAGPINR